MVFSRFLIPFTQNPLFTVDSLLDLQELTGAALEKVEAHTCR
jgi:hypothetical protein